MVWSLLHQSVALAGQVDNTKSVHFQNNQAVSGVKYQTYIHVYAAIVQSPHHLLVSA